MTEAREYVDLYLLSKGIGHSPEGDNRQVALKQAAMDCTAQLVCRIMQGLLDYIRDAGYEAVHVDISPEGVRDDPAIITRLADGVRAFVDKDAFVEWFVSSGFDMVRALVSEAKANTDEELYRRLKLTDLLEGALEGARAEDIHVFAAWLIEATKQFFEESSEAQSENEIVSTPVAHDGTSEWVCPPEDLVVVQQKSLFGFADPAFHDDLPDGQKPALAA